MEAKARGTGKVIQVKKFMLAFTSKHLRAIHEKE